MKEETVDKELSKSPVALPDDPDMLAHYNFSQAVRGKYAGRFTEGYTIRVEKADGSIEETRWVHLPPDVAAAFSTNEAVHAALREWLADKQPR